MTDEITTSSAESLDKYETFKLIKNSRGYNWEIKLVKRPNESEEELRARMKSFNEANEQEYQFAGGGE